MSATVRVGAFVGGVRNNKTSRTVMSGGFAQLRVRHPRPGSHARARRVRVIGHGVEADGRFHCCVAAGAWASPGPWGSPTASEASIAPFVYLPVGAFVGLRAQGSPKSVGRVYTLGGTAKLE